MFLVTFSLHENLILFSSESSKSNFETMSDGMVRRASDDSTFKISTINGNRPLLHGFTTTSRLAENRFRALLRSETSEEPESGISEKPVALSAMKSSKVQI